MTEGIENKLRVLVVLNWLNRGGIELMLLRAVPRLFAQEIQLDFCCLGGHGDLDQAFKQLGCNVYLFKRRVQWSRGHEEVMEVLANHRYDIIHSQFGFTSAGIISASLEHAIPCIVSIHNTQGPGHQLHCVPAIRNIRSAWLNSHKKKTLQHAALILGHSKTNLDAYHPEWQLSPGRFRVLHNGVTTDYPKIDSTEAKRQIGISPSRKLVLNVAAMKPQKNHEGLLRIFELMCKGRDDLHLSLVGDGQARSNIENLIHKLNLSDRVTLHGKQENVWTFYSAADLFLFPSHFEGFGNVLVEAQAACVPVVATDIAAIREAVCPRQHRFLFPSNNLEAAAALACEQLTSSEEQTAVIAESLNYVRSHFSIDQFCKNLVAFYFKTRQNHSMELLDPRKTGGRIAASK